MIVWLPAVAAAVLLVLYNFLISLPGILPEAYEQYVLFALLTSLGVLLARHASLLFLSILSRPGGDRPSELLGFAIGFVIFMACLLASMHYVLGADVASILATSAIATVALGFALQATLGNLFEGLSIQIHRPFRLRDMVEFTDGSGITYAGTVETLSWRAMRLRKSDNSTVTVPNNVLAQTAMRVVSADEPLQVTCSFLAPASASPGQVMSAAGRAIASIDGVLRDWPCDVLLTACDSGSDLRYRASFYIDPAGSDPERIQSLALERVW